MHSQCHLQYMSLRLSGNFLVQIKSNLLVPRWVRMCLWRWLHKHILSCTTATALCYRYKTYCWSDHLLYKEMYKSKVFISINQHVFMHLFIFAMHVLLNPLQSPPKQHNNNLNLHLIKWLKLNDNLELTIVCLGAEHWLLLEDLHCIFLDFF